VTRIVIAPSPPELGLFGPEYTQLVDELEAAGYDARLQYPREERSGGATLGLGLLQIAIHLGEHVGDDVLGVIVGMVIRNLRGAKRRIPGRRATIYGPNGETLRVVELSDSDSDS
jgi:hypothetical protein